MMTKSAPYARIAITLPQEDLEAADRLAGALDRSRSWILAEALRRFVAATDRAAGLKATAGSDGATSAPDWSYPPASRGLGASRTLQLERDLALSPEQRVRIAEETLALRAHVAEPRPGSPRAFESYEEFLDWKRDRDVLP